MTGPAGSAAVKPIERRIVVAPGVELHVEVRIGDKSAVPFVLVHGLGGSRHDWNAAVECLAASHLVITLDLSGHGSRAKLNVHPTLASMAKDIETVDNENASGMEMRLGYFGLGLHDQMEVPEADKLLEVVGQIEGRPAKILLDTGCSTYVLSSSFAKRNGIPGISMRSQSVDLVVSSVRAQLTHKTAPLKLADVKAEAAALARKNGRPVFVTMAEQGILGGSASGEIEHVPALPVRDEIDVVGAGDAVTANLTCALSSGANVREALELANAAASIVIHQLGTTGTASVDEIARTMTEVGAFQEL